MDYKTLASPDILEKTIAALKERNVEATVVDTKEAALAQIQKMIPAGASVNNGSSTTLQQIGYIDYLKSGAHKWNNLHGAVVAETDPVKKAEARNKSLFAGYYLGSVHALSQAGEMVIASASGSQIPPIAFTSKNLIFVVGTQKITPTLQDALVRLREYVFPLENKRMADAGQGGSMLSKIFIFEREPAFMGRAVHVLFIKEALGF